MSEAGSKIVRFTKGNACPICGGTDQDARGAGERCFGFRSGKWIHCSREEFAGQAHFNERSQTYSHVATGPCPCGTEHAPRDPSEMTGRSNSKRRIGTFECAYPYHRRDGSLAYETVRLKNPKDFYQRRPDLNRPGKYINNLHGVDRVLFHLPKLIAADKWEVVWICEGEKDVLRLESHGLLATTSAEGALKWRDHFADELVGRSVAILSDNDDPGHKDAQQKARSLYGKAASVKVLDLVADMPDLPEKGDVSNWLDAGRSIDRLRELYRDAPEWTPAIGGMGLEPLPTNGSTSGNVRKLWLPTGGINYSALTEEELNIKVASSIAMKPVTWIWKYRLAAGAMALIAGEGGLGKSQLILWICAAISRGWPWPDKSGDAPLGSVIIVSAEDSAENTTVPRLKAMDADLDKIFITSAPKAMVQEHGKDMVVKLEWLTSASYWCNVFDRHADLKLFVVDPVASFLGPGISVQKEEEIRSVIDPFNEAVIGPRGICFLANTHLNKNVEIKNLKHRINGASTWTNIPRNVHAVVRDEEDPALRFFGQLKCNNAPDNLPSFKFKVERREVTIDGGVIETSVPVFEKEVFDVNLNQVGDGTKGRRGPKPVASSKFADWLFTQLQHCPVRVRDLIADAQEAGFMPQPTDANPKPSPSPLYNAKRRLPQVHEGWDVEEMTEGRSTVWKLFRVDGDDSIDAVSSGSPEPEGIPF